VQRQVIGFQDSNNGFSIQGVRQFRHAGDFRKIGILAVSGGSEKQLAESSLGHGLQADVPVSSDCILGSGPKISRRMYLRSFTNRIPSPLLSCAGGATFRVTNAMRS